MNAPIPQVVRVPLEGTAREVTQPYLNEAQTTELIPDLHGWEVLARVGIPFPLGGALKSAVAEVWVFGSTPDVQAGSPPWTVQRGQTPLRAGERVIDVVWGPMVGAIAAGESIKKMPAGHRLRPDSNKGRDGVVVGRGLTALFGIEIAHTEGSDFLSRKHVGIVALREGVSPDPATIIEDLSHNGTGILVGASAATDRPSRGFRG